MLEKDMENLIARYPEEFFPNSGFELIGQQINLDNRHVDIEFRDKYDRTIFIEVKKGVLSRDAAGQILEYYGLFKGEKKDITIELILCANSIPHERKEFLERAGIECKAIGISKFEEVAQKYSYKFIEKSPPVSERANYIAKNDSYFGPKLYMPDNLRGRSIYKKVIPTVCNLKNMLESLKKNDGSFSLLKKWEQRSFKAYLIDQIKGEILNSKKEDWKYIIREHILSGDPRDFGASCIDIYLVAFVSGTLSPGKNQFFQFIKDKGISQKINAAQAIWQVGKGDGVFLNILKDDGTIEDFKFIEKWIKG